MLFPSNFLALQVAADMSDLLMNSIINTISLGHLLLHYLWFSVFLAASCFIVYAWCLLVTDNYNFHSFWYRLDEELNRIQMFLRFCSLFFPGRRTHSAFGLCCRVSVCISHCSPQRMTLQIKVETVLLQSGTDLCTEKKEQKYLATKWSCPGLFSVQKKKVVMGYLFSSRKESRRKKE